MGEPTTVAFPRFAATNTWKTCQPKSLRDIAHDYYNDSEVQMRQLIDLDTGKACSASPNDPNCYSTGVIQASIQGGETEEFVKQVCEKGARS